MCECKNKKGCKVSKGVWMTLAALWGVGFGLFMAKKTGKELRKEVYDSWEKGENVHHAKCRVFFRELLNSFRSIPEAFDEFVNSKPMQGYKKTGEELKKKGEKFLNEQVKEGKKIINEGKKAVTELKKKIDL